MTFEQAITDLPACRQELFVARLERWLPDLQEAVSGLFDDPDAVVERLVELAARAYAERSDDLHRLDQKRSLEPDWFQRPDALGYAAYADRFAGDLRGVGQRLGHLRDLGVTYLHLMPLLTPRPEPSDGGYAVMDYRTVRPDLGTMDDLRALTATLRDNGISLCLDLVLNHVAAEHDWAMRAKAGEQKYLDYFLTFPDRAVPDQYEQTLPEVFPDFAPGNFTFDEALGRWVWTTFNDYQWDVDWSNPDVLAEYADTIMYLANAGVEVLRLDAIAFTWKRMGTNCQNQPEVHLLTQALRTLVRIACPATVFKAEAIVGPQDLVAYLGTGRRSGKVSDLAYHNGLMVQIWSALATGDARLTAHALSQLPATPSTTGWITYARCHDDIGWAIDDADANALGLSGFEHRKFLSQWYAGEFPGSWARGLKFQENPDTGDARISGSLASLAGLEVGDPFAVSRILLAHSIILGFGGIPVIWMGDELGLLNDTDWAQEAGHEADNRWVHRPRMPWPADTTHPVYQGLRRLIEKRRSLPALHASTRAVPAMTHDPGVLLLKREHPYGTVLQAYNVTAQRRVVPVAALHDCGLDPQRVVDHLGQAHVTGEGVWLDPYQAAWLADPTQP
ncbi:alpha-amylase family protein [Yimella sp. cx-51]|uniref:alpha-amylase family protein n=1 Tax=Yimella sp. cx-51 TaxID=2770551 RepID=UPI00165DDEBB|nr:alpha-amylase family protein [Yimella sp. cx-51]MBC9955888.1 alpha-amylase family protein [Yimella sp. cx-51]QTH37569.1 alpha-amylase family protein [Yimella sp. cx-51]